MHGYKDRPNDYESVTHCTWAPSLIVYTLLTFRTDFRQKFGVIHHTYSPDKSRELYSEFMVGSYTAGTINLISALVHFTSVTDTKRTQTIILTGTFSVATPQTTTDVVHPC